MLVRVTVLGSVLPVKELPVYSYVIMFLSLVYSGFDCILPEGKDFDFL